VSVVVSMLNMKGPVHIHPRLMYQGMATIAEASAAVGMYAQYDFLQPFFDIDLPINSIPSPAGLVAESFLHNTPTTLRQMFSLSL